MKLATDPVVGSVAIGWLSWASLEGAPIHGRDGRGGGASLDRRNGDVHGYRRMRRRCDATKDGKGPGRAGDGDAVILERLHDGPLLSSSTD